MLGSRHRGERHAIQETICCTPKAALREDAAAPTDINAKAKDLKAARRKEIRSKVYNALWMAGPAVGLGCTLIAASTLGGFSWSADPLSIMLATANQPVFSAGLIVSGLMAAVSAGSAGFDMSKRPRLAKLGQVALTLGGISLAGIGMSFGPMHIIHGVVAGTYFTSVPLAMAAMGGAMLPSKESRKMGLASIAAAVVAVSVISISYLTMGKAVSEFEIVNSALAGGWSFAIGYMSMFRGRLFGRKKKAVVDAASAKEAVPRAADAPVAKPKDAA